MTLGDFTEARVATYREAALALLPPGLWRRDKDSTTYDVLEALAVALARVDQRALDLREETDPRTAFETLADWERAYGLPGACTTLELTVVGRQAALAAKVSALGGQSKAYYIGLALTLGYTITIEEPQLFEMGKSTMGDRLYSGDWVYVWIVHAPAATWSFLSAGLGGAGEPLVDVGNALLECTLGDLKPAHTVVLFEYDLPVPVGTYGPWETVKPAAVELEAETPAPIVVDVIP